MAEVKTHKEMINEYITKAFDYLNGRANRFNKCILSIDWDSINTEKELVKFEYPNFITVNPLVAITGKLDGQLYSFNRVVVNTMICELLHADQDTMTKDKEKVSNAEELCLLKSSLYISNHLDELNKQFNFDLSSYEVERYIKKLMDCGITTNYKRKTIADHIALCIMEYIPESSKYMINNKLIYNIIHLEAVNSENTILRVNGEELNIINNKEYVDIDTFNKFMGKFRYKNLAPNGSFDVKVIKNENKIYTTYITINYGD